MGEIRVKLEKGIYADWEPPSLGDRVIELEELVEEAKEKIRELRDKLDEAEGYINELEYLAKQEKKHG